MSLEEKVDKIALDVNEIKVTLKGYNGTPGLCDQIADHAKQLVKLWIAITLIAASIGGGVFGLIKVLVP